MKTVKEQTNTNVKAAPPPLDNCYKAAPLRFRSRPPLTLKPSLAKPM